MKTFIELYDPEFVVKEKQGIVICKINAAPYCNAAYDYIQSPAPWMTFKAVARLKGNDKFNLVKGRQIAESKCKKNIYKFYSQQYAKTIAKIESELDDLRNRQENLAFLADREIVHIAEVDAREDD